MGNTSTLKTESLVAAYRSGVSAYRMAKEHGCSLWSVITRLNAAGVKMRPGGVPKVLTLSPGRQSLFNSLNSGLLLGDASVNGNGKKESKCFLRMEQSDVRLGWLHQVSGEYVNLGVHVNIIPVKKKDKPATIDGRIINQGPSSLLYTGVSEEFRQLRAEWYPKDGGKIVPKNLKLNPLSVAMWFCGDGSGMNGGGLMFYTNGFAREDVEFLVTRLSRDVDVLARVQRTVRPGQFKISVFQRAEAVKLRDMMLPHMPECCLYKLEKVRPPKKSNGGRRVGPVLSSVEA